jgi:hypothetical protein
VYSKLNLVSKIFTVLLLSIATPAAANIGSITEFKGTGQIKRGASTASAVKGSVIQKMDTVSTNSQGRFKITFKDATTVNITENSKLLIDDFVYDGDNKNKGKLGLRVAVGTVRYTSGAVSKGNPNGVNIRTPTATIAVRGTDFVMSVDEAGRSTIVLVPICFDEDITKINFECPNGAIEVMTAAGIVSLTKPFQATMVENSFAPPSAPVIINPSMNAMNNNIQIVPLETDDGKSLLEVARDSLKKYINPSRAAAEDNNEPNIGERDLEQVSLAIRPRLATPEELISVYIEINGEIPTQTIYTNVSPTFKRAVQVGWVYARISEDKNQAVGIWTDKDSKTQIVSVQNGIIDVYNFMEHNWTTSGTGRPQGNITVIQNGMMIR